MAGLLVTVSATKSRGSGHMLKKRVPVNITTMSQVEKMLSDAGRYQAICPWQAGFVEVCSDGTFFQTQPTRDLTPFLFWDFVFCS